MITDRNKEFEYLKRYLNNSYEEKRNALVYMSDQFRGIGKSTFINELALKAKSDGYKVIVIGCIGFEYICDTFYNSRDINASFCDIRGRCFNNSVVLVDEMSVYQQYKLGYFLDYYEDCRVIGFLTF